MKDDFATGGCQPHGTLIAYIAADELYAGQSIEVLLITRREIVKNGDMMTVGKQVGGEVGADETGAAGD